MMEAMSEWTALDAELLDISVSRSRSAPADLEDVLVGLLVVHGPGETVADVEAGFRRLAGAGLLELDERRVSATVAGAELCATVKTPRGIPRLIRLHKAL